MTKFATLTPEGEKNAMEIDISKIKSPDPLAYSYGYFEGKTGKPISRPEKGDKLAKEYIRGYKIGRKEWIKSHPNEKPARNPKLSSKKEPLLIRAGDNIQEKIRKIPNIHTNHPQGFKLVKTYFVDSSGFGQSGESALTFPEFVSKVKIGKYYAITDEGQFQVYIGEFEKK